MDSLELSVITKVVQGIPDTKERARLALVCKAWRDRAVKDSWQSVHFEFSSVGQLKKQLAWLAGQLEQFPWILRTASFQCSEYFGSSSPPPLGPPEVTLWAPLSNNYVVKQ
jgi:hypothetical protein